MFFKLRKKRPCNEHTSFWMDPETLMYIKNTSRATRISQGQILQIIIDQYRLLRKINANKATEDEIERYEMLECFNRVIPY